MSTMDEQIMYRQGNWLRVLMVTPRYFPFVGGTESHVYEVSRRLARAGVDVMVLTSDPTGSLPRDEEKEDVHIRRVHAYPAQSDLYYAPDIMREIPAGQWDLVHIQGVHTFVAPLAMLAARRAHIPYVVTFHTGGHSSRIRRNIRSLQWQALRPLLTGADRLIGVSEFEAHFFQKQLALPAGRFAVIPNGGHLPELAQPLTVPEPGKLIVSVGRLEQYKGHQHVIRALPHVLAQEPDARLLILGTGPYESQLRKLASRLAVTDRVEIRSIPASEREEMARVLARASVVVLLSQYEAHPVAVMEALALKRPVLVADTSGLSEIAARGWARSITLPATPPQVAAALLGQLCQPLIPSGVELPTWDDAAAQLLSVYRTVHARVPCVS